MDANGTGTGRRVRAAVASVVCGLALPVLALPGVPGLVGVAAADPVPATPAAASPTSTAQAAQMVKDTAQQLTQLDEQVQQAREQVAQEQRAAADAAARAAAAQAAVDAYDPQLRAIAQSAVTGSSQSRVAAFLTSSSAADLVARMTTLDMIASHTETVIQQVARAADAARQATQDADRASATAQADLATLQREQQQMQQRVTDYQADFSRLSAGEQAAVTTALAGPSLPAPPTAQLVKEAPNASVATVIKAALAQVGKPYIWGSSGMDGFDCSGLTSYAFGVAGVVLPHSSRAQSTMGTPVARADLQPGDIVYFYSPVSHVALYLGNGMMVEARTFGHPVSVTSVDRAGYMGARRILH